MKINKNLYPNKIQKYGTFTGVFVPTFLTIIGVIMYLRFGFIVGAAGILGALLIVVISVSITIATALAVSMVTSNIRIEEGGAYSIISKTLGLEVGGSVGIPLFLAQTFSVVFYILGFTEGWQYIFPTHPKFIIVIATFLTLFLLTFIATKIAIRAQVIVFGIIVASLVSIFLGGGLWFTNETQVPALSNISTLSFWALFALFFPAVTGLMAGIGLSGELSDPKKQIPKGTLLAIGATTLIYIALIFWFGFNATSEQLVTDTNIMMKIALIGPLVLAGLLAATFSSALTTLVAAPRVLQALGKNNVLLFNNFFAKKTEKGEPRNAILFTSIIIIVALLIGSLNSIAPILTMFFLITYATVNIGVLLEQLLARASFRPSFKIPIIISLFGALGSIIIMFLINAIMGIIAITFILFMYITLARKKFIPKEGDIRSGLFISISEWFAKKATKYKRASKHNWKPNMLVPVVAPKTLMGNFPIIKDIALPYGSISVLALELPTNANSPEKVKLSNKQIKKNLKEFPVLVKKFGEKKIFTSYSSTKVNEYTKGIITSLGIIKGRTFSPNIVFLPFRPDNLAKKNIVNIFRAAKESEVGIIFLDKDKQIGSGTRQDIHVWIPGKVLKSDFNKDRNFDLALLTAYRLSVNWKAKINLWMCVRKNKVREAEKYLRKLINEGRLTNVSIRVTTNSFNKALKNSPTDSVHFISFEEKDIGNLFNISKIKDKTFIFSSDSGKEGILA
jgi:solute carrier family 12 (sodium/potassium/chloride transporter), member 2